MAEVQGGRRRGSALEKALIVLNAVTEQPQAIGLPDISARVGLPRQTVHRILQQLEAVGLIVRDPVRDRFSVGREMSRLALASLFSDNQGAPVRNDGYAVNIEELSTGIAAVGVPILDHARRAVAALAVQGPMVRISRERAVSLAPRLMATAQQLSREWGLLGDPGGAAG